MHTRSSTTTHRKCTLVACAFFSFLHLYVCWCGVAANVRRNLEVPGLVGDEGASVGQIQAHRRVQESTSCPAVFVCLVSTRTESDLNLVPVHAIFRALPTTFGCANSLYRQRQWPLPGRRKHKRGVAGCWGVHGAGLEAPVDRGVAWLHWNVLFSLPTDTLNASLSV